MAVRIGTGMSTIAEPGVAAEQAAAAAAAGLGGEPCDVCVVFASGAHLEDPQRTLEAIEEALSPAALIGCGAQGVLADGEELEAGTGVSVWAAALGGGTAAAFHATVEEADDTVIAALPDLEGAAGVILLTDPPTFPADGVLHALAPSLPGVPIVGGLASARLADSAALFLDGAAVDGGAVGVRLDGVAMTACVSQGAAPLGPELTITRSEGAVILELAGQPAYEKLQEVALELPDDEQAALERAGGVLLGVVVDANKPDYVQGDFLVRPIVGADPRTGAIAVSAIVRPGQVVRLHARDAGSADRDLRSTLARRTTPGRPAGALLFACTGRGTAMFGEADHDAGVVEELLHGLPTAGFFAGGEFGPVGDETFLHAFTATVALFDAD